MPPTDPPPALGRRWAPSEILRRARDIVGQQGVRALWFKILGELFYRRVHVYKELLEEDLALPAALIPLDIRALTHAEVPDYLEQAPRSERREIVARLDSGHICHAAWSDGSLVGYVWSAPGHAPIDYLRVAMHLPACAVYGYEIYVRPDCRKLGVSVAMIRERRVMLLGTGFHVGYSVLMPENTPAVGFQRAVKRIRIGTLRVAWFGPWRWAGLRLKDPSAAQPFGIAHGAA